MNNKKGFTLVELLAVIVILALIMGIAVVSIGGILNSSRQSALKETAASIINGVRQKLVIANRIEVGDYRFTKELLEKGGDKSPLGGTYQILESVNCSGDNLIGDNICKVNVQTCSSSSISFVRVTEVGNNVFKYSICLTAGEGEKYIDLISEEELLDSNNTDMVKDSDSSPTYFNPAVPTITGGATKVYNYSNTTLTCATSTTYETGNNIYYEFGYATSTANFTAGTITWLGSPSTTATYTVTKAAYMNSRYYTCRVYVSNGNGNSDIIQATTTTTMSFVNARLYFDATTNGGTLSGSANLYVPYGQAKIYTSRTGTTNGTVPTATKSGKTFTGWWTAASGGSKVIDASGVVQASVSSWTNGSKQWLRTSNKNNDTANKLYAQFS